jgi:Bacterial PH domain
MRRTDSDREPPLVYRAVPLTVLGVLSLLIGLWFLVDALGSLDKRGHRIGLGVTVIVGVLVFAATIRPALIADDRRVLIRNPFRSVSVPWSRVKQFSVRYFMDVDTDRRSYSSWAVSRPSWRREHGIVAGSRRKSTFADEAAEELTIRLNTLQRRPGGAGPDQGADGDDVDVIWSRPMLAALAVAVVVLVLTLVIP